MWVRDSRVWDSSATAMPRRQHPPAHVAVLVWIQRSPGRRFPKMSTVSKLKVSNWKLFASIVSLPFWALKMRSQRKNDLFQTSSLSVLGGGVNDYKSCERIIFGCWKKLCVCVRWQVHNTMPLLTQLKTPWSQSFSDFKPVQPHVWVSPQNASRDVFPSKHFDGKIWRERAVVSYTCWWLSAPRLYAEVSPSWNYLSLPFWWFDRNIKRSLDIALRLSVHRAQLLLTFQKVNWRNWLRSHDPPKSQPVCVEAGVSLWGALSPNRAVPCGAGDEATEVRLARSMSLFVQWAAVVHASDSDGEQYAIQWTW